MTTNERLDLNKDTFIKDINIILNAHELNKRLNMPIDDLELAKYLYQALIMFAKIIMPILDDNN